MKVLKQQQVNDMQNLSELAGRKLSKADCEVAYDALWDMLMIHQLDGDDVYTPMGTLTSYVRKPTTYTNPQHPEGERIQSPARLMPKLNYARAYDAKFKTIPVDQTTLKRIEE